MSQNKYEGYVNTFVIKIIYSQTGTSLQANYQHGWSLSMFLKDVYVLLQTQCTCSTDLFHTLTDSQMQGNPFLGDHAKSFSNSTS